MHAGIQHAVVHHGVAGVAGGEQHLQAGPAAQCLIGQLAAVDLGHHHVGEQQRHLGVGIQQAQRGRGVVGLQHRITQLGQRLDRELAHRRFVFHHQHQLVRFAAGQALRRAGGLRVGLRAGQARQVDLGGGALAGLRIHLHVAARLAHEAIDLAQAQAGAAAHVLGGEEGVEGLGQHLGRHAAAGVADGHHHVLAGRQAGVLGHVALVQPGVGSFDGQAAAVGHRVAAIDRQVEDGVFQLVGVDMGAPQPTSQHRFQQHRAAQRMAQQVGHAGHQLVHVHRFGLQWLLAREGQQPLRELRGAAGAVARRFHVAGGAGVFAHVAARQQVERADDHRQHVVEVVRDAAGELAHRLHLLRLAQGFFGAQALGHFGGHAALQRVVQLAQRQLGTVALGHVLEQHRHLAALGWLQPEGRQIQVAAGGHQLTLEAHRLAGEQHAAVDLHPAFGLGRHHVAHLLAHHVGDAGIGGVGRVGHHVHIVAQRAMRAVQELDDAKAFVHRVEQRAELALALAQRGLGRLALGQVEHGADHAQRPALRMAQHGAAVQHVGIRAVAAAKAVLLGPAGAAAFDHRMDVVVDALAVFGVDVVQPPVGAGLAVRMAEQGLQRLVPDHVAVLQPPVPDGVVGGQHGQPVAFFGLVLALARQHQRGAFGHVAQQAVHGAVFVAQRDVREREPGRLGAAVALHLQRHVLAVDGLAGQGGGQQRRHVGPDLAPYLVQRCALGGGVLVLQQRHVGRVVDQGQRVAPGQPHGRGCLHHLVDRGAQRGGPGVWRPQGGGRPVAAAQEGVVGQAAMAGGRQRGWVGRRARRW